MYYDFRNRVYVAQWQEFSITRVLDPTTPRKIGRITTGVVEEAELPPTMLFAAVGQAGLLALYGSKPGSPTIIG